MTPAESETNSTLIEFGRWRFDALSGDLFDGKRTVRLEPQVARVLDHFLAHQNILVTRDELIATAWDNRIVSDDAVNRCISILRQQLSPGDKSACIETVVRRGFISHFPPPPARATASQDSVPALGQASDNKRWAYAAIAVVAALVLLGTFRMIGDQAAPASTADRIGTPMVAVLPFVFAGLSSDSEFFAHGIHEDLLTQLAQLESIQVISRTSVSEYRGSDISIREIGRQLGADAILEGGVQRVGDQIRVNVQLIDAGSDTHLWARQYDRELTPASIFEIQGEIARSIAGALNATLTVHDATQLDVIPTDNMAAYRAYHEAMEVRRHEPGMESAYVAALERAVALDPRFVRASAELVGALSYANIGSQDPETMRRLEDMLEQIRAIAPQSSEYLIAQSYYVYYILKQHDRALELIRQAQTLTPSDPQILQLQAWIQRRQGDIGGMIESIRQARTLDPRNAKWTHLLVGYLAAAHRYDEAFEELEKAPVDNFKLAVLGSILRAHDHGDPGRRLADLLALQREYGVEANAFTRWEAHIASRDYDGAAALLKAVQTDSRPTGFWALYGPDQELAHVITDWLLAGKAGAGPAVVAARAMVEREDHQDIVKSLAMAYVTAAEGDTAETERLVRAWFRIAPGDLATMVSDRPHACRALGMAAAVAAAIECLEEGFVEPSLMAPFVEPFLPYYDPIRSDPAYVRFMAAARPTN